MGREKHLSQVCIIIFKEHAPKTLHEISKQNDKFKNIQIKQAKDFTGAKWSMAISKTNMVGLSSKYNFSSVS